MKLIHISDLHIGKRVHEFSMIEDQRYILNQIGDIIENVKADGVLIAGDVYDKSVPSAEAVQVFDSFLTRLSGEGIPVYVISGNHDSAERLSFGAELLKESGIYISRVYDGEIRTIETEDEYGPLYIHLLPFLKPSVVRHALEREDMATCQEAVEAALEKLKADPEKRNVLVAHQFVLGAGRCDSEEVSVGGLDQIDGRVFDGFDYVALGHIHSPQHVGRETIRYCGTPLKYSFSEAGHKKSVTVAEFKEKGNVEIKTIPLTPRLDLRKIKGTYLEVTDRKAYTEENRYDYMQITLTDEEDIPNAMARLRTIYPNLMSLAYDNTRTRENREIQGLQEQSRKTELELFGEFFEKLNNEPMKEEQEEYMKNLIRKLKEGDE
ncbi:MAG: exonuclease SbcCD subunit D [Eubacteriales bacterium]|nr:exonuclease SbcCD subunit D [Eubacteriales bacterium]